MPGAQILCTKCGASSAQPRQDCAKCGGRNARVCGSCGNQNSLAKNFCDKCGSSISELTQAAPPPKTVLPGSASQDIPATAVRRLPPPGPPPAPPSAKAPPPKAPAPAPLPSA
ncbi:MAG: hypothetical protein KGM24_09035, partial [Elusimicrobia bacterium]|nr:hypothetical protein [Elusimicrobiota bacterium]